MSKGTQLWPGERMRDFYLGHIHRETDLEGEDAERLADTLVRATNRMMVWDASTSSTPATSASEKSTGAGKTKDKAGPTEGDTENVAPPFNPYQFSAMVVFARSGRDGLARRLDDIDNPDNLRAFAEAQHLAIAPHIKDIDDLRDAIVAATEQRLADRKAAAS